MGKRQHYVPQFYLRRFSQDGIMIGFYDLNNGNYRNKVPIKTILFENWLYDDDDHIENKLFEAERVWSEAISSQHIILRSDSAEKESMLSSQMEERLLLLEFIGCTIMRTLGSFESMQGLTTAMVIDLKQNDPTFDSEKSEQIAGYDDRHSYVDAMLAVGQRLALGLSDLSWIYVINESSMPFITSDNPVSAIDTYYHTKGMGNKYGLGSSGIQVIVPLSSDTCLILLDNEVYNLTKDVSILHISDCSFVREINMITAQNAYRYLVFTPKMAKCHVRGIAKRHDGAVHSRLGVYETSQGRNIYSFEYVRANIRLQIPGVSIKDEALTRAFSKTGTGPKRTFIQILDSMDESKKPKDLPSSISARLKSHQIIL